MTAKKTTDTQCCKTNCSKTKSSKTKCCKPRRGLNRVLVLAGLGLIAAVVIKELRKPDYERQWNGIVCKYFPYDFRVPTVDKIRDRLWNAEGPVLSPHVFGVGWTLNLRRLIEDAKGLANRQDETQDSPEEPWV